MNHEKTIKLLADVGFMATSNNMTKHAFSIFYGLEQNVPNNPLPYIGYAFQYMNKKLFVDALDIIYKKALPLDENNNVTKSFLGMVLMFAGRRKESERYFNEVLESDGDSKSMAKELLHHIQTS